MHPTPRAATMRNTDFEALQEEVFAWAEKTFPNRTDASMFLKIFEELGEVIKSNGHADEVADLFIMMLDYARRKNIDVPVAVRHKLRINERRQWVSDSVGVMHHVK